jgi:hypothetical protein
MLLVSLFMHFLWRGAVMMFLVSFLHDSWRNNILDFISPLRHVEGRVSDGHCLNIIPQRLVKE